MPEPRRDRLSRPEAELLQQRALRQWRDSSWLAAHRPREWTALEERDPTTVCVDLSGGDRDSRQEPGYIVIGKEMAPTRPSDEDPKPDDERRGWDIYWNLLDGLPFEARVVDHYLVRRVLDTWPAAVRDKLPAEFARTLVIGGTVVLDEPATTRAPMVAAMERHGFSVEDGGRTVTLMLTTQRTPMDEDATPLRAERVLGELKIREPRLPSP